MDGAFGDEGKRMGFSFGVSDGDEVTMNGWSAGFFPSRQEIDVFHFE
jgi:hypothetical protein